MFSSVFFFFFFFSSRRRHTRWNCDWSSDVCSSDLLLAVLPPVATSADEYRERLAREAGEADRKLRALDQSGKAAAERREAVADLVRALERPGLPPWASQLKAVRQGWTGAEHPFVAPLETAVAAHLACDRFRADLEELTGELFGVAADALDAYAATKRAARVVDFQDMLALAARLLDDAGVAASLGRKLDLVVVDEFQDTSPMQLALVSALARIARRSVWVGDRKQAIFGFQGSDPVLMGEAMSHALSGRDGGRAGARVLVVGRQGRGPRHRRGRRAAARRGAADPREGDRRGPAARTARRGRARAPERGLPQDRRRPRRARHPLAHRARRPREYARGDPGPLGRRARRGALRRRRGDGRLVSRR